MTTHHSSFRTHLSRKSYPAYKPSGEVWLGDVPEHWDVKRAKGLLARNDGGVWGEDFDDDGVIVLRSTEQTVDGEWKIVEPAKRRLTATEFTSCRLQAGDLVVTKSSGSSLHIGKTSIVTKEVEALNCCYSNFMQRLRVKRMAEPRFVWYVLNGELGRKQFDYYFSTTTGLANLNGSIIGNVGLAVPPLDEQKAIAAFLGRETARIDALIEKKRRQIELLQEKRFALISSMVSGQSSIINEQRTMDNGEVQTRTRAVSDEELSVIKKNHCSLLIDHWSLKKVIVNCSLKKDSGIEWLRQIPAHWEAKRLKHAIHIRGGQVDPRLEQYGRMILIAPNHIESGTGRVLNLDTAEEQGAISGKYLFRRGDVLYSKIRPELAKACIAPDDGLCSADMYAMVPRRGIVSAFVLYLLSDAYTKLAVDESMRVAMPKINREDLGEIRWPFPPEAEQAEIVVAIETEIAPIDALLVKIQDSLDLLCEHRTALIAAAVTGKIDVQGEVAE